jgi:sugar lactone lactonase YvrE
MLTTLIDGLGFAEGLRWHRGKLWFSDFLTRNIQSVDMNGQLNREAFVPGQPSGLGFMPDGSALVVSMLDRKLLRFETEQLYQVADLSQHSPYPCNDMLIDQDGHAYIGTFSYDIWTAPKPPSNATSNLLHVNPNGQVAVVAENLHMPNGIVRLPHSNTLVVAETGACRLLGFDIQGDGSLSAPRLFADLGAIHPDGICVNAEGEIWVSGLYASEFLLVREGGEIVRRIPAPGRWAVACALGSSDGEDGKRLFCATAQVNQANDMRQGRCTSAIEYVDLP